MIQLHEFNTRWCNAPAGIVTDPAFFSLPLAQQKNLLEPYAWCEFKTPENNAPTYGQMHGAGFMLADTQIHFKIDLSKIETTSSAQNFQMVSPTTHPHFFILNDDTMLDFRHERFHAIASISPQQVNQRYHLLAQDIIQKHPETCLAMIHQDQCQGWFLAFPTQKGLNLMLAMLHRNATTSGLYLYMKAMATFAQLGHRIGYASFSASNMAVMNIYAGFNAKFLRAEGQWVYSF
jgi:hypothetical protein